MNTPILVTITAPTASGKSYLLDYIRSKNLSCLVSTTTRSPRAGEINGIDYYFISREESIRIEKENGFAELVEFCGNRYGVTNGEFHTKLNSKDGIAFLIVEPEGIDHYVAPALAVGAKHLKVFIKTDLQVRLYRLRNRLTADLAHSIGDINDLTYKQHLLNILDAYQARLVSVLTKESNWEHIQNWDLFLDGTVEPEHNLSIIINKIEEVKLNG